MSILYHCSHLTLPHAPLPPSYPSSSAAFSPLSSLFFCEECDAIRCDQCAGVEVASYFCPNCLFDVPSANVRADRNRCARSCFSCPQCSAALQTLSTESTDPSSSSQPGPPYFLSCPGCKWSSKEIGWEFEKGAGLVLQLQKIHSAPPESAQSEFDALKDHLDTYINLSTPASPAVTRTALTNRNSTRHISHLTQMAARALHRDVPGMARAKIRPRGEGAQKENAHQSWDALAGYGAKGSWEGLGLQKGMEDVEVMKSGMDVALLEKRWEHSWDMDKTTKSALPQRIPLQTKLTKRCPHSSCRHLLIQPDTKSTRFKIKMVAGNYLPATEVGRRRRRVTSGDLGQPMTAEEMERRRRERRRTPGRGEEDEQMDAMLSPGGVYTFQLAFTNPLYDPIQIRLTQPPGPRNAPPPNHHLQLPTPHFTVAALKDAWAYDEEEDDDDDAFAGLDGGSEGVSEEGSTIGKRGRKSLLASGSLREKRGKGELGVEKKGNMSKVGLEVEVLPGTSGPVEFDLEVRYTYRAEDPVTSSAKEDGDETGKEKGGEEFKTFTFWIRVNLGEVDGGVWSTSAE